MVKIVPSERQIAHQQTEFYAFVHFTVNTFTGLEWGDEYPGSGDEGADFDLQASRRFLLVAKQIYKAYHSPKPL